MEMDNTALTLLRSAIWKDSDNCKDFLKDALLPANDKEWQKIAQFFTRQALDGLLPDAISLLPVEKQPQKVVKMPMIARQIQVRRRNCKVNKELLYFIKEINSQNIPYFVLKGQCVALMYPTPTHRVSGDIDLYIPKRHIKEVARGITAFGAIRTDETRHHINYKANGVDWELHHKIYYFQKEERNRIFMRYVEKAIQAPPHYETIDGEQVRVIPPTLNAVTLLTHILDHFYCEGIGLRQLCDLALTLHHKRGEIDKTEFLQILEELSLKRSYRIFGYLCAYYLGLPEEDLLLKATKSERDLAHKVMDDCIRGGNFGHADSNSRLTLQENITFYTRFLRRLWKYRALCPSEALWWPIAKIWRAVTRQVSLSEKASVLNS